MKRNAVFILLIVCSVLRAAASGVSDFFISEPDSLFALIDKTTRMDMVDYYRSGKKIDAANRLDGTSRIVELSDKYMKIKMSEASDIEMRIEMSGNSDTVIVVSKTLHNPSPDSELMFFNRYWEPLNPETYFSAPVVADFMENVSGNEKDRLLSLVEYPLISFGFDESGDLIARVSLGDYMIKENYEQLKPFLKDKIVYRWNGKKYKQVK